MSERITAINEYRGERPGGYGVEAGFQVVTTEQVITLAIDDESSCCEEWGYFLSEDDFAKFIGAELRGVSITDTNLTSREFLRGYSGHAKTKAPIYLDEGDTLFVNLATDRGTLQFAAYNSHNGYYGHEARVSSAQLKHEVHL